LTESEANLKEWRENLLAALGINGQVWIDVIPEIELIISKQTARPEYEQLLNLIHTLRDET